MARLAHHYRAAVKRLAPVDADLETSHQHEITGVSAFKSVLSESDRAWNDVPWVLLRDSGDHVFETHYVKWYDARERHPRRSEWRLYFDGESSVTPGDLLALIVRQDDGAVAVFSAPAGSSWESQLARLLGEPLDSHGLFVNLEITEVAQELSGIANEMFGLVGWEELPEPPESSSLELALERFGGTFPPTSQLSAFVREQVSADLSDPDATLTEWWLAEEALFFGLERALLEPRVTAGFETVEEFISFSLSVQNRRKSRAGYAFENHLQALFAELGIRCSRGQTTEGRRRPDFLFPGIERYRDPEFDANALTMLGVKTTCKDRWRQVLTEAARIPRKHLCTLEPAISATQLDEMSEDQLTIVAPRSVLGTYPEGKGERAVSVADFVTLVRARQAST